MPQQAEQRPVALRPDFNRDVGFLDAVIDTYLALWARSEQRPTEQELADFIGMHRSQLWRRLRRQQPPVDGMNGLHTLAIHAKLARLA